MSKLLFGGDKLKIKATADEGNYVKSLTVDGTEIFTNDDTSVTETVQEVTVANKWPSVYVTPEQSLEVVPVFEKTKTFFLSGLDFRDSLKNNDIREIVFTSDPVTSGKDFLGDGSYYGKFSNSNMRITIGSSTGGLITFNPDSSLMFSKIYGNSKGFTYLKSIIGLENVDTSSVVKMDGMFSGLSYLNKIEGLSSLNTSKVTSMASMFYDCISLTSIDVSGFDTSKVTNMASMFGTSNVAGNNFTELHLENFDTTNVTSFKNMFLRCADLTTIYSNDFDIKDESEDMFNGCTSLVGGSGTVYDDSKTAAIYARVDNASDYPGYFTLN